MGEILQFKKRKLLIGVLFSDPGCLNELMTHLERYFGAVDYTSAALPFHYTRYYEEEMGKELKKIFYSFQNLVGPETLSEIKARTNTLEDLFTHPGGRRINLDPGLLDQSRLILATTKDHSHRIPLQHGIYGEITLIYTNKQYRDLPWTYPDFRSREYKNILCEIRNIFSAQLKQESR